MSSLPVAIMRGLVVLAWCASLARCGDLPLVDFSVELAPRDAPLNFTVAVHEEWAPLGAKQFLELVEAGHYDGCTFFRVINKFMAQFGISGDVAAQRRWRGKAIKDEASPVVGGPRASNPSKQD